MTWEEVGKKIRAAREEVGITQEKMAEYLEMSPDDVKDIEAGKRPIDLDDLMKIADLFGRSPQYFLGKEDAEEEIKILYRTNGLTERDREKLSRFFAFLREYMFIREVMGVDERNGET